MKDKGEKPAVLAGHPASLRDIDGWRREMDDIDGELTRLLNRRAACAIEIGRLKLARGLPIYVPQRENEVLGRVTEMNPGPLTGEAIRRLFERIIDESRSIERRVAEAEIAPAERRDAREPQGGAASSNRKKRR
jgi:chorismate mutase